MAEAELKRWSESEKAGLRKKREALVVTTAEIQGNGAGWKRLSHPITLAPKPKATK